MISRCYCKSAGKNYKRYGGRGIQVYYLWHNFLNFADYMPQRPSSKHSIDRINNDGNYEPGNVRWATQKQQANNTCKNDEFTRLRGISRQRKQQLRYRRDGKCQICGQLLRLQCKHHKTPSQPKYFDKFNAMTVGKHEEFDVADRNSISIALTRFKQRSGKHFVIRKIDDMSFAVYRARRTR
jgi:hypothetical protein